MRRLAPRGRGSEEFDPSDAAAQDQRANYLCSHRTPQPLHHLTLGQMPLARGCSETVARLDLKRPAALADAGLQR